MIGIVESHSAVYNADGLDVIALKDYHARTGTLLGFPGVAHQLPSTYTCVLRVCIYSCISTHIHTHTHTHMVHSLFHVLPWLQVPRGSCLRPKRRP